MFKKLTLARYKENFMKWFFSQIITIAVVTLGGALFLNGSVFAVPTCPFPQQVEQADGTIITITGHGDEFFSWAEDEDGYVIAYDQDSNNWCHAYISSEGSIAPGNSVVGSFQRFSLNSTKITRDDLKPLINNVDTSQLIEEITVDPGSRDTPQYESNSAPLYESSNSAPDLTITNFRQNMLLILIEYNDAHLTKDIDFWRNHHFGATGKTVNNYYNEVSGGKFQFQPISFTVNNQTINSPDEETVQVELKNGVARVKLNKNHPGYSDSHTPINDDVILAFDKIESYIDFSESAFPQSSLQSRHIKREDFQVYAVVAGWEASTTANASKPQKLHAHARIPYISMNNSRLLVGVNLIDRNDPELIGFAVQGELYSGEMLDPAAVPMGVGVTVHELGHALGLPDLYDTTKASEGLGPYSVMANGSWGAAAGETIGYTPVHFDAWSKTALGFVTPIEVDSDAYWKGNINSFDLSNSNVYNMLKITSSADSNQYFLVDNRSLNGYDAGFEAYDISPNRNNDGGIMIYHVDESVTVNNEFVNTNRYHRAVDIEEADGSYLLENKVLYRNEYRYYNHFFSNTPYTKTNNPHNDFGGSSGTFNIFSGTTTPNSNFYNGDIQDVPSGILLKINSERGTSMEVEVGSFVAVTDITGVPSTAIEGIPLTLTATIEPSDSKYKNIVWSVKDAGTTGASITANTLNTTGAGTVVVTATIANGTALGTPYTKDFTITVNPKENAQTPVILAQPAGATTIAGVGTTHNLTVTAELPNSGTLSYQWYVNTTLANIDGTPIEGATSSTYAAPTETRGIFYYYVIITNTIPDNGDGGTKTAIVTSNAVTLTVVRDITDAFADSNFLAAVREIIGKPTEAIYDSDVEEITELNLASKNISDLSGIEYFIALTALDCDNNQLTELDVSNNAALNHLVCSNNYMISEDMVVGLNKELTTSYVFYPQYPLLRMTALPGTNDLDVGISPSLYGATLFVAIYNSDGMMVDIATDTIEPGKMTNSIMTLGIIPTPITTGTIIKAMVWNDLSNAHPACKHVGIRYDGSKWVDAD